MPSFFTMCCLPAAQRESADRIEAAGEAAWRARIGPPTLAQRVAAGEAPPRRKSAEDDWGWLTPPSMAPAPAQKPAPRAAQKGQIGSFCPCPREGPARA